MSAELTLTIRRQQLHRNLEQANSKGTLFLTVAMFLEKNMEDCAHGEIPIQWADNPTWRRQKDLWVCEFQVTSMERAHWRHNAIHTGQRKCHWNEVGSITTQACLSHFDRHPARWPRAKQPRSRHFSTQRLQDVLFPYVWCLSMAFPYRIIQHNWDHN